MQRFVNSIDLLNGEDELESPEALGAWFAERGLMDPGERVSAADVGRAVDVREGLRALLLRNNGLEHDEAKVARLDRVAIVAESVAGGSWERLKACPREECEWAFFDRSKNRSGRWCRMEECGNLAKARAFRERRRRGPHSTS